MRKLINRLKSDEALMLAYQRGDVGAFECLYERHKDGLYGFLYRSCPRIAVVEELAQDAWMAVINSVATYQADARFKTWLYQIAHNRQVDFWRRHDNSHGSLAMVPEPVDDGGNPAQADMVRRLMQAVTELPPEQRDALLLQQQGFSLREIADITGALEETVKSRLRYARKQLREHLGEEP